MNSNVFVVIESVVIVIVLPLDQLLQIGKSMDRARSAKGIFLMSGDNEPYIRSKTDSMSL